MILAVGSGVIFPALRIAGITHRPGRTPAPDQSTEAIQILNGLMESWSVNPLDIFATSIDRYALTPQQTTYFIGPQGDFVAPRPLTITAANIVLTNQSPELHMPMTILDAKQWAALRIPELPGGIWPTKLYYDYADDVGDAEIHLYPYPTQAMDLELFTPGELQDSFVLLTDSATMPPGYQRAMVFNLALELAAFYPDAAHMAENVPTIAADAKAIIESRNAQNPHMVNDTAGLNTEARGESRWWLTGGF